VTYERLEGYKTLQCGRADGTEEPLLYTKTPFPDASQVVPVAYSQTTDQPDEEFDLAPHNGRLLEHFHEGNMTYRSDGIRKKNPGHVRRSFTALATERRH